MTEPATLVEMLGAIADAANAASSAAEAFRVALEEICAATGWPAGHVYAVGAGDALADIGTWHAEDGALGESLRTTMAGAPGPGGAAAQAAETGEPRWMAFPGAGDGGVAAVCAVPVHVGDAVVAVLELFSADPAEPEGLVMDALQTVGVVAGRVVERAQASDRLRRVQAEAEQRADAVATTPAEPPPGGDGAGVVLRDPPTGLLTPTYLEEALRIETARAERGRRAVTVIALGLDALATLGAGRSAAVESVGTFVGGRVRKGDLAARYGDEFVVVMPGVSVGMGRVRTQQLRKGVEGIGLTGPDGAALTASAGFACFPDHGSTETDLLEAAHEALERAQAEGGSRLQMAKLSLKRWTGKR